MFSSLSLSILPSSPSPPTSLISDIRYITSGGSTSSSSSSSSLSSSSSKKSATFPSSPSPFSRSTSPVSITTNSRDSTSRSVTPRSPSSLSSSSIPTQTIISPNNHKSPRPSLSPTSSYLSLQASKEIIRKDAIVRFGAMEIIINPSAPTSTSTRSLRTTSPNSITNVDYNNNEIPISSTNTPQSVAMEREQGGMRVEQEEGLVERWLLELIDERESSTSPDQQSSVSSSFPSPSPSPSPSSSSTHPNRNLHLNLNRIRKQPYSSPRSDLMSFPASIFHKETLKERESVRKLEVWVENGSGNGMGSERAVSRGVESVDVNGNGNGNERWPIGEDGWWMDSDGKRNGREERKIGVKVKPVGNWI